MYERLGARIWFVCLAGGASLGLLTIALTLDVGGRYMGLSFRQGLSFFALWAPICVALLGLGLVPSRRQIRTILSWSGTGRTPANAPAVWHAVVRNPMLVARATVVVSLAIPPAAIDFVVRQHLHWWAVFPLIVAVAAALAGVSVLVAFAADLIVRPMLDQVASHLPADFEPPGDGMRLLTKAVAPLPIVAFFAAILVGAYANLSTNGTLRLMIVLGIALATIAVASVIFLIISSSVLAPVHHLTAATRAVRDGDITATVPLVSGDELGALSYSFNQMLAELRRHTDELRSSRQRIVAAADAERRRAERDLHDGAQQQLLLVQLKLGLLGRAVGDDAASAATVGRLRAGVDEALAELRDLARGIYPALLENEGLPGALTELAARAPMPVRVELDDAGRYPHELEAAVYFCCVESLHNAARYAGEKASAAVRLAAGMGTLRFAVEDDGCGFEVAEVRSSAGLQNMIDRIGALGGELRVRSEPGGGTRVGGEVPL